MGLKKFKGILYLSLAVWAVVSSFNIAARSDSASAAARKKARHYFMAGAVAQAEGKSPEAYELFKKACVVDPDYDEAAYHFGLARLQNDLDTMRSSTEIARSLEMVRRFVDNHPDDEQENLYYAYLAGYGNPAEAVRVYERTFEKNPTRTAILLQLAEAKIRNHEIDNAIKNYDKYESIEGAQPEVSMRKIQLMFYKADTIGAISEADRLIKLYPADARFRMMRSSLAGAVGDSVRQEQDLLESNRLDPDNAMVKVALAELALNRGDSAAYDNYMYQALITPGMELAQRKEILGEYLSQILNDNADKSRGDYLFEQLGKLYPHEPELLDMEARYRVISGNVDEGIELMQYAIDLDPENETYYHRLLGFGAMAKRYDVIEKAYQSAKAMFEPDNDMRHTYAWALSLDGKPDKAIEVIGEILQPIIGISDPAYPISTLSPFPKIDLEQSDRLISAYTSASDIYWKAKRPEETFATCVNALFLDPGDPLVLNNYAYFLAESDKELEKAREMAEKALEVVGDNPTYLDTYAWVLFKAGEYDDALRYLKEALAKAEENNTGGDASAEFYEHLAAIQKALGNNAAAREASAKAKSLSPDKQ